MTIKHRCSLSPMPSDIISNHIAQIPYLNQPFELVAAEAKEAGFTIERWGDTGTIRDHIHTLQVRAPDVLIVRTDKGIVKAIGNGCWVPIR